MLPILLSLFLSFSQTLSHRLPETEHEIEVQRALRAASYHCAPAVESFTASRKQAWAQQVLAGSPGLPAQQHLFSAEILDSPYNPDSSRDDETLMNCAPISDTHIQNNTCVLTPEVEEGPYYHREEHPLQQNIARLQDGVLLLLDIGVIDVETCKPLPNVLVDIWHANSTGYYAGHPVRHPPYPRTAPQENWLRGAWPTDRNGVAQFITIYPGYYPTRATHIHAKVFTEWAVIKENNTFKAGRLSHVGQIFFEEELNEALEKMYPYVMNPTKDSVGRTLNRDDPLFPDSHGPDGKYNPVFNLHLLGGVVSQGFVGYITMGINASASYENFWRGRG